MHTFSEAPTVAVWQNSWLATSLTFIRDQVGSMSRWQALKIGYYYTDEPMLQPDWAPFPETFEGRITRRLTGRLRERSLRRLLARPDIHLVHAHFGSGGIDAARFAAHAGKPLVVTFHGQDIAMAPFRPGVGGLRYRLGLNRVFDQADRLIAVSEFIAERLLSAGADPAKVVVHHIGVDLDHFSAESEPASARHGVIFVGRLVEKKGVADLISAMSLLPPHLRKTPLTIVGFGPLEDSLRLQVAALDVNAHFVGRRTSDEVRQLLSAASVFCGPSRTATDGDSEGLPIVFLEAAAEGLPVVATEHGGASEAVLGGTTGLLTPEGDVPALAAALTRVLDDRGLAAAFGHAGQQHIRANFDIRAQTAQLEQIYDSVTNVL